MKLLKHSEMLNSLIMNELMDLGGSPLAAAIHVEERGGVSRRWQKLRAQPQVGGPGTEPRGIPFLEERGDV